MHTQIRRLKTIHSTTTILNQLRHTLIYNLIIGIFIFLNFPSFSYAVEFGEIKYNNAFIDYSKIDKGSTKQLADFYFQKAFTTNKPEERKNFLQKASREYFVLTQVDKKDIYPIVQMARVYDFENENSYAKAYFFKALKIDRKNPLTNYYFGEYYLRRDDYKRSLYFYNTAFENGFKENYNVLVNMAIMYEKLGDLLRANQYYKKAYLVNPSNTELPEKIMELESLNYQNSEYYKQQDKRHKK